MTELAQSSGRKVILEELKKLHSARYAKLLEVREWQDKPVMTEDQLLKRELHFLEYLWNLPLTLVKTSTSYTQDLSKSL
jgi:hypothetical protein